MKVLVTGSEGQLGRALLSSAPKSAHVLACSHDNLDITNGASVVSAVQAATPDIIINAAAYTAVDRAESQPQAAHAVNAAGAGHLARAAQQLGSRLVHISTDFVFDGTQGRPYRPDDEPNPLNVYGASKLAGERAVHEACPGALIVRTAWLYAPAGKNFVLTMLRLMQERDALQVVDDQVGTPTSAASLAGAIWHAVDARLEGVHHWTDAGVASWYDFAVAIQKLARRHSLLSQLARIEPVTSVAFPRPAPRPANTVLDKSATYAALGPAAHWTQSLDDCLKSLS